MTARIPDDDPSPDRTVMRPRAGIAAAVPPRAAETPPPQATPAPTPQELLGGSALNPLVRVATPLLLLAAQLRELVNPPRLEPLRAEATRGVREFEDRARALGISNELVLTSRYLLCTALDEAVLDTPWGSRSPWAAQTLLMVFHREAWGGEKFFQILDRAQQDPRRYVDLLELIYISLALGFAGKYRIDERGPARLAEVQRELFRRLTEVRGTPEPALSPHWRGVEDRRNPVMRYVPLWVVLAAAALVVSLAFVLFYSRLSSRSQPLAAALAQVGLESLDRPPPAAPAAPPPDQLTLKRLLADEEARGALQVLAYGDREIVDLGGIRFASARTEVKPEFVPTLLAVAEAVNQLGGHLLVQGHTDDVPLRSLRYANNHELSAERAKAVAAILQQRLKPGIGVETVGRGPDQPRCEPVNTAANRACNRRVEIVLFPAAQQAGQSHAPAP